MEEIITLDNDMRVRISQDEYAESPREWGMSSTMVCNHRRYDLGDEHLEYHGISMEDDFKKHLADKGLTLNDVIWEPLYLYDHSGITMNTTGFSCRWDSGQVGYIYETKEEIRHEFNVKRVSKKLRETIEDRLKGEVETYDMYLRGDVYYFIVEDEEGDLVDSCGGFYGFEYAKEEAERLAKEYDREGGMMLSFDLHFGGFYCSQHEDVIDMYLEDYFRDPDTDLSIDFDELYDVNYRMIFEAYSKQYLESLEEFISDEYGLDISLRYKSLQSSRFYNYETDTIRTEISDNDYQQLRELIQGSVEIPNYIDEHSMSRSGFISFYNGYEAVEREPSVLMNYAFMYICEQFNYELPYDDFSELLYDLDFYREVA